MRIYRLISTAIGGVLFAGVSSAAHAGCFGAPAPNCNPQIMPYAVPSDRLAPINTYGQNPYGYLKTFAYKNTPDVNTMRLRSRTPMVSVSDVPSGFTGGCNPTSVYCISQQKLPRALPVAPPAPMPQPVMTAPLRTAPALSSYTTNRSYVAHSAPTQLPSNGAYWEKVTGPTLVNGLPATQILCRREAPRPAPVTVRVVRPVIGVPVPVPTPVPVPMSTCGGPVYGSGYPAYGNGFAAPALAGAPAPAASRYGSRWTY